MFNSKGEILQVSRAKLAIQSANNIWGVCGRDCAVIATRVNSTNDRPGHDILEDKIYKINDQIVVGCAGIVADVNFLVDQMRLIAQRYKCCYGSSIPVEILVKNICDIKQAYTQYANRRPFGVAIIYIGYDRHQQFQLYKSEPGGSYDNWYGTCVGENPLLCLSIINTLYDRCRGSVIDIKTACDIAINTFLHLNDWNCLNGSNTETCFEKVKVVVISLENNTPTIKFLSKDDIEKIFSKVSGVFTPVRCLMYATMPPEDKRRKDRRRFSSDCHKERK
ncbi:proteasome subunit alpha type-4-like [Zeugodacus cucurbitae]|uniref:proteasome subunit alpha type-4-like n=1 Tax=Zeugodacus cucurbitae TaxID=28588 RepID=UPI0023D91E1A|nr:proteasome subunit alpha type-4-like [Zeugodacus cucurbitae]XP_028894626.2 proteasome subunit alpha type-4-like [Zeugodacus cucurbitae]